VTATGVATGTVAANGTGTVAAASGSVSAGNEREGNYQEHCRKDQDLSHGAPPLHVRRVLLRRRRRERNFRPKLQPLLLPSGAYQRTKLYFLQQCTRKISHISSPGIDFFA